MNPYLWVPNSARAEPLDFKYRCHVPGCDAAFANRSAFANHVARCAKKNSDALEQIVAMKRDERYGGSAFSDVLDKEQVSWVKRRQDEGKTLRGTFGARQGLPKKQPPREAAKED